MIKIILRLTISLSHNQWFRRIWCLHTITIGMILKTIHIGLTTTRAMIRITSIMRQVVHDLKHLNLPHSRSHHPCRLLRPLPTSCPIHPHRRHTSGIRRHLWAFDRFLLLVRQRHASPRVKDTWKLRPTKTIVIVALWVARQLAVSTRNRSPLRRHRAATNSAPLRSRS